MPGSIITAGTTRTQAGAALITEPVTRVDVSTSTAGTGDGVILPVVSSGANVVTVINNTTNPIQVYAQGSDTINGIAGATGVAQSPGTTAMYVCAAPALWTAFAIGSTGGAVLKPSGLLAQSAVPSSVTGTISQTALASLTIPGNAIGPNGSLRITTLWTVTNNSDTKSIGATFGGTVFMNKSLTTSDSFQAQTIIRNRGVTNSQVSSSPSAVADYGSSGANTQTGTVDTTQNQTLNITGTLGTSSDTITLESYTVEVLNP